MTTANEIISEGFGKLGLLEAGETVQPDDAAQGLLVLNTLVDALNLPSNFAYTNNDATATLGAGVASLTIGPAQSIAVTRPVRIEPGSYSRLNGIDYPMDSITEQEYNLIQFKTNQGTAPNRFFYDAGASTGIIYYHPVPVVSVVVHHPVQQQASSFADLTTVYTLPQGLKRVFVYNFALDIAPDFEREAPPTVITTAAASLREWKRANSTVPRLRLPSGLPGRRLRGSIWSL